MSDAPIPAVERTVVVVWSQEAAFRRFTSEFPNWWPRRTHTVGGERVARLVFEAGVGGSIFEEHCDGRRFQWGLVREWAPPSRVRFAWHPSRDPSTAQDVEVRFETDEVSTHVRLIATGWDHWGRRARQARNGYAIGWWYVLQVWAGRRTMGVRILEAIGRGMQLFDVLRGGTTARIARARGEMARMS